MNIKEKSLKRWFGDYKGVDFEINNLTSSPNDIYPSGETHWTYYLHLRLNGIPEENDPDSYWLERKKNGTYRYYAYYKHSVMSDLDWHGGITWYSKERGFDGEERVIKIGCDYSHLWDEGYYHDLEDVKNDCKRTIERFLEKVPNYKNR